MSVNHSQHIRCEWFFLFQIFTLKQVYEVAFCSRHHSFAHLSSNHHLSFDLSELKTHQCLCRFSLVELGILAKQYTYTVLIRVFYINYRWRCLLPFVPLFYCYAVID